MVLTVLLDRPDYSIFIHSQISQKTTPLQQPVKRTPYKIILIIPICRVINCCNNCDRSCSSPRKYILDTFEGIRRDTEFLIPYLRPKRSVIPKYLNEADKTSKSSNICTANGRRVTRGIFPFDGDETPYVSQKDTNPNVYIRNYSFTSRSDIYKCMPTIRMKDTESDGFMDIVIQSNGVCIER